MKKFIYNLLFMAVSIVSAVNFVSCTSDEEEFIDSKSYAAALYAVAPDLLDLYDFKIEATDANGSSLGTYTLNTMQSSSTTVTGLKEYEILLEAKSLPVTFKATVTCSKKASDLIDSQTYDYSHNVAVASARSKEDCRRGLLGIATIQSVKDEVLKQMHEEGDMTKYEYRATSFSTLFTKSTR